VRAQSSYGWFTFAVRVNGLEFQQACLRLHGGHSTNFEVVIRDPQLGSFALHEEFILEIREGKDDRTSWRPISLAELETAVLEEAQQAACDPYPGTSTHEGHCEVSISAVRGIIGRIPVDGDSSHVGRVDEALTRAGIRFQIVGGLDSRGRSACHVTLVVRSLVGARACLRRGGFLGSPESKYVLIDSRTGWKVRLLEGRPSGSR
jgi:hypothetical protein